MGTVRHPSGAGLRETDRPDHRSAATAEPSLVATGESTPTARQQPADPALGCGHECLEEVLAELHRLAQRVGGMKRLAEILANLEVKG